MPGTTHPFHTPNLITTTCVLSQSIIICSVVAFSFTVWSFNVTVKVFLMVIVCIYCHFMHTCIFTIQGATTIYHWDLFAVFSNRLEFQSEILPTYFIILCKHSNVISI